MEQIKPNKVTTNGDVVLKPYDDRRMRLGETLVYTIYTEEDGVIRVAILNDFLSDGRSGGKLLDLFLPHWGNQLYAKAVLLHDALYASGLMTHNEADILLEFMMIKAGIGRFRRRAAFMAVESVIGKHCYYDKDEQDEMNKGLVTVSRSSH